MEINKRDKAFEAKYERAKKRMQKIRGFYVHLAVYLVVNTHLLATQYIKGLQVENIFWEYFFIPSIWGLALLAHGVNVFLIDAAFTKKWEEKRILKFMQEDIEK